MLPGEGALSEAAGGISEDEHRCVATCTSVGRRSPFPGFVICLLILGSCVPSTPFDPVAVRKTSSGAVEVLYVPCWPAEIQMVEVIAPNDVVCDDDDKRFWKIVFEPRTNLTEFTLGEVPPSASEVVPWSGWEEGKAGVVVLLTTPSDFRVNESFRLEDLDTGKVLFHSENMTPEEFEEEKERTCE
jgi:hypothetical protein